MGQRDHQLARTTDAAAKPFLLALSDGSAAAPVAGRRKEDCESMSTALFSAVRTAWPATRPAYPFLQFCPDPLNVLPSRFRFLDGDNPADPFIARKWRNILPLCPRRRVRNENLSQIRWHTVHRARGNRFLAHGFHSTSLRNQPKKASNAVRIGHGEKLIWISVILTTPNSLALLSPASHKRFPTHSALAVHRIPIYSACLNSPLRLATQA